VGNLPPGRASSIATLLLSTKRKIKNSLANSNTNTDMIHLGVFP
jgi:hypothetical protein